MQHNKYINKIVEMNFSPLPKYKGKLDTTMSRSPAKKKKKTGNHPQVQKLERNICIT